MTTIKPDWFQKSEIQTKTIDIDFLQMKKLCITYVVDQMYSTFNTRDTLISSLIKRMPKKTYRISNNKKYLNDDAVILPENDLRSVLANEKKIMDELRIKGILKTKKRTLLIDNTDGKQSDFSDGLTLFFLSEMPLHTFNISFMKDTPRVSLDNSELIIFESAYDYFKVLDEFKGPYLSQNDFVGKCLVIDRSTIETEFYFIDRK